MLLRKDFPFFDRASCVYLDSAATAQKPRVVIDRIAQAYAHDVANIYRGIYCHAERVTDLYENAREKIAHFIGAGKKELSFNAGTTMGINSIAATWGSQNIKSGDEMIISVAEHHSNLIAWQQLAQRNGAVIKLIPLAADGTLDLDVFESMLSGRTKLVAITYVSNVLGTVTDIGRVVRGARRVGARVLIDAAQAVAHRVIHVRDLDVDFLAFSGHKVFGPTGIGALYIKHELFDALEPFLFGGGMVQQFDWRAPQWLDAPRKFEAGTAPVAQVLGLAQAVDYVQQIGFERIRAHETALVGMLLDGFLALPRVRVLGSVQQLRSEGHMVSFVVDGVHAHDVAAYLDAQELPIAVRAGQQCASLLHQAMGINASVRVSFSIYNTAQEVAYLLDVMKKLCADLG